MGPNMDKNLSLGYYVEQIFKKSYELFLELLIKINSDWTWSIKFLNSKIAFSSNKWQSVSMLLTNLTISERWV